MKRSDIVIQIVAKQHRITVDELLGKSPKRYLIAARRDVMLAMKAEGLRTVRIAEALGLSQTTVREQTNPIRKARRRAYCARRYRERMASSGEGVEC